MWFCLPLCVLVSIHICLYVSCPPLQGIPDPFFLCGLYLVCPQRVPFPLWVSLCPCVRGVPDPFHLCHVSGYVPKTYRSVSQRGWKTPKVCVWVYLCERVSTRYSMKRCNVGVVCLHLPTPIPDGICSVYIPSLCLPICIPVSMYLLYMSCSMCLSICILYICIYMYPSLLYSSSTFYVSHLFQIGVNIYLCLSQICMHVCASRGNKPRVSHLTKR